MEKSINYVIIILVGLLIAGVSTMMLHKHKQPLYWAVVPTAVAVLAGMLFLHMNKEDFEIVNSTVNIVQNCGGVGSSGSRLDSGKLKQWMLSVHPKLTEECQECVVKNVSKLWSEDILDKVSKQPMVEQKIILAALLAFDCSKNCSTPWLNLDEAFILGWVMEVGKTLSDNCKKCAITAITKLWSPEQMNSVVKMPIEQQEVILKGVIALNCKDCDAVQPEVLSAVQISDWLNSLVVVKPDCMECVVKVCLKMWDLKQFMQVKSLDKASQMQVAEALMVLDCDKQCVSVPSGLDETEIAAWLFSLNLKEPCLSCLAKALTDKWTVNDYNSAKALPPNELQAVLYSMIELHCKDQCQP